MRSVQVGSGQWEIRHFLFFFHAVCTGGKAELWQGDGVRLRIGVCFISIQTA